MGKLTLEERFFAKVDVNGPTMPHMTTPCHVWTGQLVVGGRGQIYVNGKYQKSHRVAFLLAHGRWPNPCALHHCDTPRCVNPSHLYEGTQLDNAHDRSVRGRHVPLFGEANGSAKLTEQQAIEIRTASGSHASIAVDFGISKSTVGDIRRGLIWSHVTKR